MSKSKNISDNNLLDIIITMVKETPNDMELGREIRQLFNV